MPTGRMGPPCTAAHASGHTGSRLHACAGQGAPPPAENTQHPLPTKAANSSPQQKQAAPTSHESIRQQPQAAPASPKRSKQQHTAKAAAPTSRSMSPEAGSSMLGAKAGWLVRQGVRAPTRSRLFHSRTCPAWSAVSSRQSSVSFTPYTHLQIESTDGRMLQACMQQRPAALAHWCQQPATVPAPVVAGPPNHTQAQAHPISSPSSRWCALEATRQSTLQAAGLLALPLAAFDGCWRCCCRAAPRPGASLREGQAEGGPGCCCCCCCWWWWWWWWWWAACSCSALC